MNFIIKLLFGEKVKTKPPDTRKVSYLLYDNNDKWLTTFRVTGDNFHEVELILKYNYHCKVLSVNTIITGYKYSFDCVDEKNRIVKYKAVKAS